MPAATNPKKQSLAPSSPLRRRLRASGHALSPIVQIGKSAVTTALKTQIEHALYDHELVKVKIGTECPSDRFEVAAALATLPGAQIIQILGRTILIYKRHPQKPRFEGASAAARAQETKERATARTRAGKMRA